VATGRKGKSSPPFLSHTESSIPGARPPIPMFPPPAATKSLGPVLGMRWCDVNLFGDTKLLFFLQRLTWPVRTFTEQPSWPFFVNCNLASHPTGVTQAPRTACILSNSSTTHKGRIFQPGCRGSSPRRRCSDIIEWFPSNLRVHGMALWCVGLSRCRLANRL
jgi:hypothetical protein